MLPPTLVISLTTLPTPEVISLMTMRKVSHVEKERARAPHTIFLDVGSGCSAGKGSECDNGTEHHVEIRTVRTVGY